MQVTLQSELTRGKGAQEVIKSSSGYPFHNQCSSSCERPHKSFFSFSKYAGSHGFVRYMCLFIGHVFICASSLLHGDHLRGRRHKLKRREIRLSHPNLIKRPQLYLHERFPVTSQDRTSAGICV